MLTEVARLGSHTRALSFDMFPMENKRQHRRWLRQFTISVSKTFLTGNSLFPSVEGYLCQRFSMLIKLSFLVVVLDPYLDYQWWQTQQLSKFFPGFILEDELKEGWRKFPTSPWTCLSMFYWLFKSTNYCFIGCKEILY